MHFSTYKASTMSSSSEGIFTIIHIYIQYHQRGQWYTEHPESQCCVDVNTQYYLEQKIQRPEHMSTFLKFLHPRHIQYKLAHVNRLHLHKCEFNVPCSVCLYQNKQIQEVKLTARVFYEIRYVIMYAI